jgi:hypothetical protein
MGRMVRCMAMPKHCIVSDRLQQSSLGKLRSLAKRSLASKVDRSEERHHRRMDHLALAQELMGQGWGSIACIGAWQRIR